MTSTLHNTTMNRRNSNDSESRINPNDPVSYTTQYAPHNASLATAEAGLPQASQTQEPAQSTTDTNSGGIFSNATETAKQYIPTSTTTTNNSNPGMLANATETVKQYMPESVAGVLKNVGVMERDTSVTDATSLPSQENKFAPSRGGVGTLPGTLSETSVAKLPQEKEAENKVGHELGREGVLGTEAEERPVGLMDIIAESKRTDVDSGIDTASKFINLDVLPTPQGTPSEGTTLKHAVPDNRPAELKTEPSPLNNGPERMQSEPSKEMEKAVNKPLPPAGGNTNDFKHTPHESKKVDDPKNTGSVLDEGRSASDTTYTQDQAKRKAPRTEPSNVNEATSSPPKPTQQGVERKEEVKHEETKGNESNDKSGKVSLTQKLKGEVKVISGKLSNNPAKVEEGQALKKGNTA